MRRLILLLLLIAATASGAGLKGRAIDASAAGDGLEKDTAGNFRVKLDGSTLSRSSSGMKTGTAIPVVYSSTSTPSTTDDTAHGYKVGDVWIETDIDSIYICVDATTNAADWASAGSASTLAGTTDSTDNAVLRADGTGGSTIQSSALVCDDSGNLSGIGNITLSGTVDGVDVSAMPSYATSSDSELAALAGTTSAANTVPYFTGAGTATTTSLTQGGRALIGLSWYSGTQVPSLTAAGTAGMLTVGTSASNLIQLNGYAELPAVSGVNLTSLPGTGVINTQVFTSSGTWTKPSTGTWITIICIGGGGGGGGGAYNTVTAAAVYGGGGGGGGAYARLDTLLSAMGSSETVTRGAGGPGGASRTSAGNGNAGTAGGDSTFGSHLTAKGGGAGNGATGTNGTTNAASNSGGSSNMTGWGGGAGSVYSGAASTSVYGAGGGGYGGPFVTGGSGAFNGGAGGAGSLVRNSTGAPGGSASTINYGGTNYVAAGAATSGASYYLGGGGGGGGSGNHNQSGVVPSGTDGALYGGGGGGGGATRVSNSGKGGDGANGMCVAYVY